MSQLGSEFGLEHCWCVRSWCVDAWNKCAGERYVRVRDFGAHDSSDSDSESDDDDAPDFAKVRTLTPSPGGHCRPPLPANERASAQALKGGLDTKSKLPYCRLDITCSVICPT